MSAASAVAIVTALCVRCGFLLFSASRFTVYSILEAIQIVAALICCLSSLSIPRRPSVKENSQSIDGQYTVSALRRYTFSWAGIVLALARQKRTLDLSDLPKLHHRARSAYLEKYFRSKQKKDHLWKGLVVVHYAEIIFQMCYASVQSVTQFLPQVAMYLLLRTIEIRSNGAPIAKIAWIFVIMLGLSMMLASWVQAWLHYIAHARLGQPVRSELSAMIFAKATRRKDVKGVQNKNSATPGTSPMTVPTEACALSHTIEIALNQESGFDSDLRHSGQAPDVAEEDIQKTRQSTINLVVSLLGYSHVVGHQG